MSEQAWPWPERYSCDGDEYHDVYAGDFVVGARPCLGCPSCRPELADDPAAASSGDTETAT